MFNLLKSDAYRLVHGKMLWVTLAVTMLSTVVLVGLLSFVASPEFAKIAAENGGMQNGLTISVPGIGAGEAADEGEVSVPDEIVEKELGSYTEAFGSMYVNGGFLAFMLCIVAALAVSSDFDSGFAKSILMGRSRRMPYYVEKLVLLAIVALLVAAVGMVSVAAVFPLGGWSFAQGEETAEIAAWACLVWLVLFGYMALTAAIVWGTRSKVAGIVFSVLVPLGTVSGLVAALLGMLAPVIPALEDVPSFLPYGVASLLGGGTQALFGEGAPVVAGIEPTARVALTMGACAVVGIVLALSVCRRKDV